MRLIITADFTPDASTFDSGDQDAVDQAAYFATAFEQGDYTFADFIAEHPDASVAFTVATAHTAPQAASDVRTGRS